MPTLSARKPKAKARAPRATAKRRRSRGPSFAEGLRPFFGMVKNAPSDLSMREGFGR